jgi:anti-sigma regulatory factor (Ser/Thr protein kinase)
LRPSAAIQPRGFTGAAALNERENNDIGGRGFVCFRQFADSLEYQATPTGNRLSIGFSSIRSAIP